MNLLEIASKNQMTVTDVSPQILRGLIWIEINGTWRKFPAIDFFDFLAQEGKITGHDPKQEIAWNSAPVQMKFNPLTDQPEEYESPWTHESRSYESWLHEFIDDDAVLMAYVTNQHTTPCK